MNKINKFLVYVLIIIYVASIVYSEESSESANYDYNSEKSYKNPDFLRNSDPAKWDAKKVDWSNSVVYENPGIYQRKDIYSNPQVYNNPEFYKNLPDDKYSSLDYKQVQFDKIDDHSKVDGQKYVRDLGCNKCGFFKDDFICKVNCEKKPLQKDTVTYSKDGITHKGGDHVSIPGTYADSSVRFTVTADGIQILSLKKQIKIPETDTVTLKAIENKVTYSGKEVELSSGNFFFKNGEMFIKKDNSARVYGLELSSTKTDIKLFFDGNEHGDCQCTYVSMDKDRKIVVAGATENADQKIKFRADNILIKLQGPLEIRQNFGTITVRNRENEGLVPEIDMKFDPRVQKSSFIETNSIRNGNAEILVYSKDNIENVQWTVIDINNKRIEYKSNPLVISIEDNKGQSVLGSKEEPKKMIFGENNEISTLNYQSIASLEPINLYFRSADDVKTELDKAKAADQRIKELQDAAKAKWGNPGMRIFGYLDDFREAPIIRALVNGCNAAGVSLNFCTSVAFNEGLNIYIDKNFYENQNAPVSGFVYLGLDNFGSEAAGLKKGGYLRQDFEEFKVTDAVNEKGQRVKSSDFPNIDAALEALGARLKYTQDLVLRDAAKYGYKLNSDQLDYWTYVYWNCGPACRTQKLQNGQDIPTNPGKIGQGDPVGNSKRVLATRDLISKSGMFDRTLSQKIASK